MGATEELGRPPPRESRQEGLGVCEDFLEEEDPPISHNMVARPCRKFTNGKCLISINRMCQYSPMTLDGPTESTFHTH